MKPNGDVMTKNIPIAVCPEMTLKERVLAAFRFEEVRPTPYTVWYDHETKKKLDHYYGNQDWQSRIRDHIIRITLEWRPHHRVDERTFRDVNGSLWQIGNPPQLLDPALKEPCLGDYEIPSYVPHLLKGSDTPVTRVWKGRYGLPFPETQQVLAEVGDKVYTEVDFGYGLFESAWMVRGFEEFYMDLVLNPSFAHGLLDMIMERQLEIIDQLAKLPCDAILLTDDFGDQRGVNIGPELWRTFVKPRLAKMYDRIHAAGKTVFHHSCGNIFDIIPDMIDIGLDVLQSVQPEAMPVYEIKKRYGKNLCLWGGLGTQQLLPFGSPDEIKAEVRKLKKELGKNGGYVFSSCKPIMNEIPIENVVAMIDESIAEDD